MGDGRRPQRVAREVQALVAAFLRKGFHEPLRGLVTVTRVDVQEPIRTAKIYISVLGSDADREESFATLTDNVHEIQRHIGRELRMKFIPKISLHLDRGFEHMDHVSSRLRNLSEDE